MRASGLLRAMLGLIVAAQVLSAKGEIVIDRTRIIYTAAASGVTLNLRNEADGPRLVQVWIDEGDPQAPPELSDVPFTVTPPILKLEAGKAKALRVVYHAVQRPAITPAQESVYWLNVLGIRPTAETNSHLQFAFRTRIKLFLRPDGLPGRVEDAVQALQWRLDNDKPVLLVRNPGAYHVTLSSIVLLHEGSEYRSEDPPMLLPQTAVAIAMPGRQTPWRGPALLRFTTLDDHGITREHGVVISSM